MSNEMIGLKEWLNAASQKTLDEPVSAGPWTFVAPAAGKFAVSGSTYNIKTETLRRKVKVNVYDYTTGGYNEIEYEVNDGDHYPTLKIPDVTADEICTHEWKAYVGLTQQYDYCTKCDMKKGD